MSNFKYLYIFPLRPSRTSCYFCSLKNGSIFLTFVLAAILTAFFILDLKYSGSNLFYIFAKHVIYSALNFISFVYMVKSSRDFAYREAYFGNLTITWALMVHLSLLIINPIFSLYFSAIMLYPIQGDMIVTFLLPNIGFSLLELLTSWISFSYTTNLGLGNDALVDGQNFDRYAENLASGENSKISSPRNSERSLSLQVRSNGNIGRRLENVNEVITVQMK